VIIAAVFIFVIVRHRQPNKQTTVSERAADTSDLNLMTCVNNMDLPFEEDGVSDDGLYLDVVE
jgi:hypothetical protein